MQLPSEKNFQSMTLTLWKQNGNLICLLLGINNDQVMTKNQMSIHLYTCINAYKDIKPLSMDFQIKSMDSFANLLIRFLNLQSSILNSQSLKLMYKIQILICLL